MFELVPQALLNMFPLISGCSFEGLTLKSEIIKKMEEIIYFPSIEYLQEIRDSEDEEYMVRYRARCCCEYLNSLLEPEPLKFHLKNGAANQEIKLKLYGNTLNMTKRKLSPIKSLDSPENFTLSTLRPEDTGLEHLD